MNTTPEFMHPWSFFVVACDQGANSCPHFKSVSNISLVKIARFTSGSPKPKEKEGLKMKRNNACEEMKLFPGEAEVSVQLRLKFWHFRSNRHHHNCLRIAFLQIQREEKRTLQGFECVAFNGRKRVMSYPLRQQTVGITSGTLSTSASIAGTYQHVFTGTCKTSPLLKAPNCMD